jgi:hypothetical protein
MERRLARLEARRRPDKPWIDPFPAVMRLWTAFAVQLDAERHGRLFSPVPLPARERSPEAEELLARIIWDCDRMAERLRAEMTKAST